MKVKLENLVEWQRGMKRALKNKKFKDLCLWMDSTDFSMQNKGGKKGKTHIRASNATLEERGT